MGVKVEGLVAAITHIAHQFDPTFDAATIELRESKGGKYLGITVTVTATSREQLDELYRTLSTHPMVKVVLRFRLPPRPVHHNHSPPRTRGLPAHLCGHAGIHQPKRPSTLVKCA
jgi:putative lipoic acid-binding regulatory protein